MPFSGYPWSALSTLPRRLGLLCCIFEDAEVRFFDRGRAAELALHESVLRESDFFESELLMDAVELSVELLEVLRRERTRVMQQHPRVVRRARVRADVRETDLSPQEAQRLVARPLEQQTVLFSQRDDPSVRRLVEHSMRCRDFRTDSFAHGRLVSGARLLSESLSPRFESV